MAKTEPKDPKKSAPGKTKTRLGIAAVVLVAGAGIGLAIWMTLREKPLPEAPLANAPADATAVGWVDAKRLLASGVYRALVGSDGDSVSAIREQCGFDPLAQIDDAVVWVIGERVAQLSHVGVIARGDIDRKRLVDCITKSVGARGGGIERVEIEGVAAIASKRGSSHAAFLGRNGMVAGDEGTVRSAIRVFHGAEANAASDEGFTRLWRKLAQGRDAVIVGRVPANWRPPLVVASASAPGLAPLARLDLVGLSANISADLGVGIVLELPDAAAARTLKGGLEGQIRTWLDNRLLSLTVAGLVLRRVELDTEGRDVIVTGSVRADEIQGLLALRDQLGEIGHGGRDDDPEPTPAPTPDDTIRPTPPPAPPPAPTP